MPQVYVERKLHRESWSGERSVKVRATLLCYMEMLHTRSGAHNRLSSALCMTKASCAVLGSGPC